MPRPQDRPVELRHVLDELVKLSRSVDFVERNVSKMLGRIEPFEGEKEPPSKPWLEHLHGTPKPTLQNVMIILDQIDKHIRNIEYDLSAMRSTLNEIVSGPDSRAYFGEWVDRHKD